MNNQPPNHSPSGIAARALGAARPNTLDPDSLDYLSGLNPEQQEAVLTTEGPVLVLAGAGTGKTRVLTTRITHILQQKLAWPSQILAVTFTNKAAREMKNRIAALVGDTVEGMPWLGTFHSISAKILRRHAELIGLKSTFTILDTDDQIRLLKQLIIAENIDIKRWPARHLAGLIDSWKNKAQGPDDISEGEARSFGNGNGRELYRAYQDRLKTLNACDFGDLLLECVRLFRENPDILRDYHRRFKYILVDEYQDTNVAQYLWLRLLSQATTQPGESGSRLTNICCVGDDDQSIYGWRGAEVDNILRFDKDFQDAKVIRLERNYRSTSHILKAASHLISHNEGRLGKKLFTEVSSDDEEKVKVAAGWDSLEEARAIGEEIESLQRKSHTLNQIAILVRASFQMRAFEERFVSLGLNYRVIGGPRFYERLEIRDAMAYFRVVSQPADDLAFERIVNTPKRGLGEATIRTIRDHARTKRIPMLQAVHDLVETEELKPKQRTTLKMLALNFSRWSELIQDKPHTKIAEMILEESGYTDHWQNETSADAPGRLENLKELIRSMEEFESLAGFMEHVSLVMDTDNSPDMDAVNLMTLHSAKGLEFDTVFLPGWEEGLFPHQRSLDEGGRAGLEEERRLAYVGITRARLNCHIWFVSNRQIHGQWQNSIPSRFLDELPIENVEIMEMQGNYGGYSQHSQSQFSGEQFTNSGYNSPGWKRAQAYNKQNNTPKNPNTPPTIDGVIIEKGTKQQSDSNFTIGERVFHMKFGYGAITAINGDKLTIEFEKAGEKRVLDSFVERH